MTQEEALCLAILGVKMSRVRVDLPVLGEKRCNMPQKPVRARGVRDNLRVLAAKSLVALLLSPCP